MRVQQRIKRGISKPLRHAPSRDENGLSLLEAAIVLPVIAGLLFGVVQYGMIFGTFISLRNAATVTSRTVAIRLMENGGRVDAVDSLTIFNGNAAGNALLNFGRVTSVAHSVETIGGVPDTTRVLVDFSLPLFFPFVVPRANADGTLTMTVDMYARAN